MNPVSTSSYGPEGRDFHGVVTAGQRGQVAIPAKTHGDPRIEAGAQLVVLAGPNKDIALIPLELPLSKRDNPVTEPVRSMLPGVMQPDGGNANEIAGKHADDVGKVADDGGGSRRVHTLQPMYVTQWARRR